MKKTIDQLLGLMLASSLLFTASCGNSDVQSNDSTDTTKAPDDTTAVSNKPAFDKCDYNGDEFRILAYDAELYTNYFFADEQNGDAMNDAVYQRELFVEDYLGINMEHTLEGAWNELATKVSNAVMSGDDTYQLALTHTFSGLCTMVTTGVLYDWNELKYCDFSKDYWNQNCMSTLKLNGHNFFAVSDFMLPDPNGIVFSKQMIDDFKLEDPYELVRSGDWTLDKMIEMGDAVSADINGDGSFDINDQYGIGADDNWEWNSFLYSSGLSLVNTDKDGKMKLAINGERIVSLVEKIDTLIKKSNTAFIWKVATPRDTWLEVTSGRLLFEVFPLKDLHEFRDSNVEFGILPYPKLSATQETYQTNNWSGLMCVPATIQNPDMVGKACELLAYYSRDNVFPIYYDIVLGEKLSRDEDSKEMLDIIFDNIVYDPGISYCEASDSLKTLFYFVTNCIINGDGSFASFYAQHAPSAEEGIADFYEKVTELG